jgi:glycerophosphoryl diester phosphodiesterase
MGIWGGTAPTSALIVAAALALAACEPSSIQTATDGAAERTALAPANLPALFDCLRERGQTLVSAHRGGPARGYPENSIEALAHTISETPAILEVDVGHISDDTLVLMHDETANRTTDGRGDIDRMSLEEFQALRLRDETGALLDMHPPTLRQALDWAAGRAVLALDVKRSVSYEDVVAEVQAAGAMNRVIFITYSANAAARMARVAPDAMLFVTIESADDLSELARRDVNLAHVVAWTGVDEPNSSLNVTLAQAGVETSFGTLGGSNSWDARFERAHQDQYAVFADTGLSVISTDRPAAAFADLDANDGDPNGYGALQCVSAN